MDIDSNTKCYDFQSVDFHHGVLDGVVDCTYVIHLEGNGRLEHIHQEINRITPTKKVFVVKNKGYKKCEKKIIEQASYQDLTDAFLQCLKHAKSNRYKNVLILEDDFILDEKLNDPNHVANMERFVHGNQDKAFVYFIGVLPIVSYPTTYMTTYRALKSLTMHSVIYSEKVIQHYDRLKWDHKHWDVIVDKSIQHKYMYYTPLCYQTFPQTENRKSWGEKDGTSLIKTIKDGYIRAFGMDESPKMGFVFMYILTNVLFFVGVFLVVFVIYKVARIGRKTRGRVR
jgi:hypothetical protein